MTTARDVLRSTEDSSCNDKDTMTTSTDELKELRLASTLPQRQDSTERCLLLCRRSSWKNDGQKPGHSKLKMTEELWLQASQGMVQTKDICAHERGASYMWEFLASSLELVHVLALGLSAKPQGAIGWLVFFMLLDIECDALSAGRARAMPLSRRRIEGLSLF